MSKDIFTDVDEEINVDDIKRRGDAVRENILEISGINPKDTAPNTFNYDMSSNSIGLSEISNVDMGYAGNMVDSEHPSKRRPYLNELEYNVNLMKESENAIVILNGGLFTYVPKSRDGKLLSYSDQIAYFYSLFKDLAQDGKIVAMVRGTDEHRILKNHGIDVYGVLEEALGLKGKVCNDALVNVAFEDDMVENPSVSIRTNNWNNTAVTTAYIGRKMEERAIKRGGADIFLSRTVRHLFKTAVVGESYDGEIEKKPIYLISAGPYTPFKGAMTAGAEYNSIKDIELVPNSFWYKITVEPRTDGMPGRPYIVRVNPIEYVAHQITEYSTDKTTVAIMNMLENATDEQVKEFLEEYNLAMTDVRTAGAEQVREVLTNNRNIAERNSLIHEFRRHRGRVVPVARKKLITEVEVNGNHTDGFMPEM